MPVTPGAAAGAPVAVPAPVAPPVVTPGAKVAPAPAPLPKQLSAALPKVVLSFDAPVAVNLNDLFSIQINEAGAANLYSAVFVVTYPKNLEVQTESEGPFLKQNGIGTKFQAFNDKKKGEIWLSLIRATGTEGASGNGVLATVTFKAVAKGTAPIGVSNPNFTTQAGAPFSVSSPKVTVEVK